MRRGSVRRSTCFSNYFPLFICVVLLVCILLNEYFILSHREQHEKNNGPALETPPAPPTRREEAPPTDLTPDDGEVEHPIVVSDHSSTSESSDNKDGAAPPSTTTTSPFVVRPWPQYDDLSKCPSWDFGPTSADEGLDQPWMLPEPRTPVHRFGGSDCRVPFGPRIRVSFAGLRGKEGYGDDEEMNTIADWKEREALRRSREEHHDILMAEVLLQLRCRVAGIDVLELEEDDGGVDDGSTRVILHPMPSDEVKSVGLHAAHKIVVSRGAVAIWAGTRESVAYAVSSLIHVFMEMHYSNGDGTPVVQWMRMPTVDASRGNIALICGAYEDFDGAVLSYRGLMVDVARHFLTIAELVRIMHVMSHLKLNALHLHLSDDQGWRLAMSEFPELSSFGSRRGPNVNPPNSKYGAMGIRDNTEEPEAFTVSDTRRLRRVARLLHIALIPEVDVPAHSAALIRAAEASRRRTNRSAFQFSVDKRGQFEGTLGALDGVVEVHEGCRELDCDEKKRSDSEGGKCANRLAVNCMGGTHGLVIPTKGSVEVVKALIDSALRRHFPSSPYIHIGGDETAQFSEPKIMTQALRSELEELWGGASGGRLSLAQAHHRLHTALRRYVRLQHKRSSIVWDDAVASIIKEERLIEPKLGEQLGDDPVVVQWWRDWHPDARWQSFRHVPVLKILSPTSSTYFDASQHSDRKEDLYHVQDGTVTVEDVWKLSELIKTPEADGVLGVSACLWSETLVNASVVWYQLLPRLAALAAVAWGGGDGKHVGFDASARKLLSLVNATLSVPPQTSLG